MRKKGFTLVELLAVIVVLGVIMAIAGTAVLGQRKKANIEEAKKIEQTITDLGPGIYSYESLNSNSTFMHAYKSGDAFKISTTALIDAGYLDGAIKNPSGNGTCAAYLVIYPSPNDEMFKGYVDCPNLYATGQEGNTYNNANYEKDIKMITKEVTSLLISY